MKDTPENRVKKEIVRIMKADGWMPQANPQFGPYVVPGRPDLEFYKNGMVIFVECKSATGRQSDAQKKYQAKLEHYGMTYVLARSVDDMKPYLTRIQSLF